MRKPAPSEEGCKNFSQGSEELFSTSQLPTHLGEPQLGAITAPASLERLGNRSTWNHFSPVTRPNQTFGYSPEAQRSTQNHLALHSV